VFHTVYEVVGEISSQKWVNQTTRRSGFQPTRSRLRYGTGAALHQAAQDEGCDFPGLGPHSFGRREITWRQEVGASAIEAQKIAGHRSVEMTGEYTFVGISRQDELTRAIQEKLAAAGKKNDQAAEQTPRDGGAGPAGGPTGAGMSSRSPR